MSTSQESVGQPYPRFQNCYYYDKKTDIFYQILILNQNVEIQQKDLIVKLGEHFPAHLFVDEKDKPTIELKVPLPDKAWVVLGCDDDIHGNLTWIHKVYYNENKARQSVNNLNAILGHFKAKYPNFEVIDPELRSQKIKYLKQQLGDHNENIVNWHHLQYAVQEVELSC